MIDKTKYIVLDVETNGLSSLKHDLLSISIFQPDTEKVYNKFLPLELNDEVLTTHINGITKKDLLDATELSQSDVNNIISEFDIDNRIILTYGSLDEKFIKNYFKRHNINGFERFNFYNFKRNVISSKFSGGNITKDNLCKLYGIENVTATHTGHNDCILEWQLFEKMNGNNLFITEDKVFEFNDNYIIPASYLGTHTNFKYHINDILNVNVESTIIKKFEITSDKIRKFPTNFNGMVIEHLINTMLKVKKINSSKFLLENKKKLKYIGKLPSVYNKIYFDFKSDGTVSAVSKKDKQMEKELNAFISSLKKQLLPLTTYISKNIFSEARIMSQGLVIHKNKRILALCDLSSKDVVLEVKTNYYNIEAYKEQLYYESNGRTCYILQLDWTNIPYGITFVLSRVIFIPKESKDNNRKIIQIDKLQKQIKNDDITVLDYTDSKSKIKFKCNICEHEWESTRYKIINHPECPFCNSIVCQKEVTKQTMNEKQKKQIRESRYITKLIEKSNGKITAKNYVGSKDYLKARCLTCNYEWDIRADHLLERPYCPKCRKMSKIIT